MPDLPAARMTDPIAHTRAMMGLLTGLGVGIMAGAIAVAVVATGGLGAAAAVSLGAGLVGGAAGLAQVGMSIGEAMSETTGVVSAGSMRVLYAGLPAARAGLDVASCALCGAPSPIAQGSDEVFVEGAPAARASSKTCCGSAISKGATTVLLAGRTVTVPGLTVADDVPGWARTTLTVVTYASMLVGTGAAVSAVGWGAALGGLALGFVGGEGGGYVGAALGRRRGGELGARVGAALGGLLGGALGGFAGARLGRAAQALTRRPSSSTAAASAPSAEPAPTDATRRARRTQPDLERTQPDLERTQPDLERTQPDLERTQPDAAPPPHEQTPRQPAQAPPAQPPPAQPLPRPRPASATALEDLPLDALVEQSPSLSQQVREFRGRQGTIEYGDAGGGAYYLHAENRIVIDRRYRGNGRVAAMLLAHEVGHAYDFQHIPRTQRIGGARALVSEGVAVLVSMRVRAELLAASRGAIDIGIGGRNAAVYQLLFERFARGTLAPADAVNAVARFMSTEEFPHGPHGPRRTYFEEYSLNDPGCVLPVGCKLPW